MLRPVAADGPVNGNGIDRSTLDRLGKTGQGRGRCCAGTCTLTRVFIFFMGAAVSLIGNASLYVAGGQSSSIGMGYDPADADEKPEPALPDAYKDAPAVPSGRRDTQSDPDESQPEKDDEDSSESSNSPAQQASEEVPRTAEAAPSGEQAAPSPMTAGLTQVDRSGPRRAAQLKTKAEELAAKGFTWGTTEKMNIAFIYSPGGYRDGLIVSLRSACLTDSQPHNVALHVFAIPTDMEGALQLQREWDAASLPCSLNTFGFDRRDFVWDNILKKTREHYANDYNFVQHIDLPTQLGRRGVRVALVIDSDVVFLGRDPIRISFERCINKLKEAPDGIACSAPSNSGWGMGAVIFNTEKYAALEVDRQIYDFAVTSGKIYGTKPLMNGFFRRFNHLKFLDVKAIQKSQHAAPCDQGISHFANGPKPWSTTFRQCVESDRTKCATWAYCMWWVNRKAFTEALEKVGGVPAPPAPPAPAPVPPQEDGAIEAEAEERDAEEQEQTAAQPAEAAPAATNSEELEDDGDPLPADTASDDGPLTPQAPMNLPLTPRDNVNVAFLYQGRDFLDALIVSMSSVCRTSTPPLVSKVTIHVMLMPNDGGAMQSIKDAWAADSASRSFPGRCVLEVFEYEDKDFDWKSFRTITREEEYRLWQGFNLPTELGRREAGIVMVMDVGPVMLQEGAAVLAVTRCESWLAQDYLIRLACLNKNWNDPTIVVNTNKFYDINADQDAWDWVRVRLERNLPTPETTIARYISDKHRIFRSCSMPSELPRVFTYDISTCDRGIVSWHGKQRPWKAAIVRNCSMSVCSTWARCQWGKYSEKQDPQVGAISRDDYRRYYDWYVRSEALRSGAVNTETPEQARDRQECDLKFLTSKLYLWTMIPSLDWDLLEHFLDHYQRLGVQLSTSATILIHKKDEESVQEMLKVLEKFEVSRYSITDRYISKAKKDAVNNWISSLPEDSWALYPDSDEFFTFPCSMEGLVRDGVDAFRGEMMERLAEGYMIPALRALPRRISEQYPISCPYRKNMMQGNWANKYMLFKTRDADGKVRRFKDSHRIRGLNSGGEDGKFNGFYLGPIPHYYFIGRGACDKLKYKQELYTKGIPAAIYQKANKLIECKDGTSRLSETVKHEMAAKCAAMEVDC